MHVYTALLVLLLLATCCAPVQSSALESGDEFVLSDAMFLNDLIGVNISDESGMGIGPFAVNLRGLGPRRLALSLGGIPFGEPDTPQGRWSLLPVSFAGSYGVSVRRGQLVGEMVAGASAGGIDFFTPRSFTSRNNPKKARFSAAYGSWDRAVAGLQLATIPVRDNWLLNADFRRVHTGGYRRDSRRDLWSYRLGMTMVGTKNDLSIGLQGLYADWQPTWRGITTLETMTDRQANLSSHERIENVLHRPTFQIKHIHRASENRTLDNRLYLTHHTSHHEEFWPNRSAWEYDLYHEADLQLLPTDLIRRFNLAETRFGLAHITRYHQGRHALRFGGEIRYQKRVDHGDVPWIADPLDQDESDGRWYDYTLTEKQLNLLLADEITLPANLKLDGRCRLRMRQLALDEKRYGLKMNPDYTFLTPLLGVRWQPAESGMLYGHVTRANREPDIDELFDLHHSFIRGPIMSPWNFSNFEGGLRYQGHEIKPETIDQVEFGGRWQTSALALGLTGYWLQIRDQIVFDGGILDDAPEVVPNTGNAARSFYRGLEFDCRWQPASCVSLTAGGNVATGKYTQHTFLFLGPSVQTLNEHHYAGKLVPGFPNYKYRLRTDVRIAGLQLWTNGLWVGRQYLDGLNLKERSVDPYFLLDMGLEFPVFRKGNSLQSTLYVGINNVTDSQYETGGYIGSYWVDGDREPRYFVGLPRNYRVGIEIDF